MQNLLRFELHVDDLGKCHVSLTDARHHETVYWTASYRDMASAERAIRLVRHNVATAAVEDRFGALRRLLRLPRAS